MSIDVRLAYQRETGDCIDTINQAANGGKGVITYVRWLEDKLATEGGYRITDTAKRLI